MPGIPEAPIGGAPAVRVNRGLALGPTEAGDAEGLLPTGRQGRTGTAVRPLGAGSRGGVWFDSEPVVHSASEFLFAPEVPLRRLDGDMPQEKLDLLELAAGQMAQPRASTAQIVWSQFLDAGACRRRPDDIPEHLRRHPVAPDPPRLVDRPKDAAL